MCVRICERVCVCVCVAHLYSSSWLIEKEDWLLRALWCVWSPLSCWPLTSRAAGGWDAFGFSLSLSLSRSLLLSFSTLLRRVFNAPRFLSLSFALFIACLSLTLSLAVTHLTKPGWHDQSSVAMVIVPLVWWQQWWQLLTGLCLCL